MGQDNFRKCSMCHHFSEIFQCVINSQTEEHKLSYFLSKAKNILKMENIGQLYRKHKIPVKYVIVT